MQILWYWIRSPVLYNALLQLNYIVGVLWSVVERYCGVMWTDVEWCGELWIRALMYGVTKHQFI